MKTIRTYDSFTNESVRDMLKPKDNTEFHEVIKDIFMKCSEKGSYQISSDIHEYWEQFVDEYNLFDNYYLYENEVFYLFDNWVEGDDPNYQLSVVYRDSNKFKIKLENALKKLS